MSQDAAHGRIHVCVGAIDAGAIRLKRGAFEIRCPLDGAYLVGQNTQCLGGFIKVVGQDENEQRSMQFRFQLSESWTGFFLQVDANQSGFANDFPFHDPGEWLASLA